MIFFKKNNIFTLRLFITLFALISNNKAIFSMIEHGPELPNIFQYPKTLIPTEIQTDQFIVSDEEEKEREQKAERLVMALAIKTYSKNNGSDPVDIILHNAFEYLPLKDIRRIRLSGKQACAIMNEMIKQSTRGIIIGKPSITFVTPTKNNRLFNIHIRNEKETNNANNIVPWGTQFIDDISLNIELIYIEIDTKRFSPVFLKKIIETCSKQTLCQKLRIIECCILDIDPYLTNVSDYINILLDIANKKNNTSQPPLFSFNFNNKNNYLMYEKTLENQLKNITFPQKPYTMEANFESISCKKVPSLGKFLTQPNTLEELNINSSCDNTDILLNHCCGTPQKELKHVHICHDKTFEDSKQTTLIANFFDNTVFPSIERLSLESFLQDIDTLDPLIKNISTITNNTITSLTLKWFLFSRPLLEYFLKNIRELKELILDNCAIKKLEQKILTDDFKDTLKLEYLETTWNGDIENDAHSLFFSMESLEHLCSFCPALRSISIETLLLKTQADFNQFLLFIKKLSNHVRFINFNILASSDFLEMLENDRKTIENDLNNLKAYLTTKNFKVKIETNPIYGSEDPELSNPFSITITKK